MEGVEENQKRDAAKREKEDERIEEGKRRVTEWERNASKAKL